MGAGSSNDFSHDATLEDLVKICKEFNRLGVHYLLIGGWSIILTGHKNRVTQDIDFLVDTAPGNVAKIKQALSILADQAALEIDDNDLIELGTVRVIDEVVIDLMDKIYEISYQNATSTTITIDGTEIALADKETLIKIKGPSLRNKDKSDVAFLITLD